ncbi:MAG: carbohydrate ABC transporter permease [Tissierellaceae bacterium]
MDNIWKRTLLYLLIVFISLSILIPLSYLVTISFSSQVEVNDYPKKILPSLYHNLAVEWDSENQNYILMRKNNEGIYRELYISSKYDKFRDYMKSQLNVDLSTERIEEDFLQAKNTGEPTEFKYYKSFLNNYIKFFTVFSGAERALVNSIKAALITIIISMSIGGAVGYALARTAIKRKETIRLASLIVRMFPMVSISVPMAVLLVGYGLFDSMLGLAIVYSIPNIGLTAAITRSIFMGVSKEYEEASLVFGATGAQTFRKITLPLVLPAFAASSMYAFITAWNDTAVSLLLTNKNETLALLIYKSIGGASSIHYAASGAIVLILPALVFTFLLKNYITQMWG